MPMFTILFVLLLVVLHKFTPTQGLHNNNNNEFLSRRKMIESIAASSIILPSVCACRRVNAVVSPPLPIGTSYERVQGIGGGFDMLVDRPIDDVDILFPPSLNGTWVCERKIISVEGDVNQAQGAWKLLGGTIPTTSEGEGGGERDFQKVEEKYYVRFVDLRRDTDGIIGLDGKKYYGDVFDRGYEMEERTSSGSTSISGTSTVVQWDPRAPNTLKYERSSAGTTDDSRSSRSNNSNPATELKVVQRKIEPQNNKGSLVGSNELIRVTTKTNALFGSSFDITYATRVQRRWRRSTTEEGDRVVEGIEIQKTYRVLDGIAGIEFPTSTVKSTIRLTRTYPTRPPTA